MSQVTKIGLYYIENPIRSTDANELAFTLLGAVARDDGIRNMIKKCDILVSDIPEHLILSHGSMLDVGCIRNDIGHGNGLTTTGHPFKGIAKGIFIYGPIPNGIGVPICYDPNHYFN